MTKALAAVVVLGSLLTAHSGAAQGYSGVASVQAASEEKHVEALQDRIESQPEMIEAVRSLLADPAFQDVLNDPEITAALESGNLTVLLTNPKISALVTHPTVQDMSKKLGQ